MAVSELPWQAFASSPLVMSAINFCSDILPGSPVSQPVSGGVAGISEYNQKAGGRLHRLLWPPSWQQRPLPPRVGFVYKYFHFQGMWGVGYGCYKARNLGNTRRIQGGKGCGAPVLLQAGGGGNAAPRVSLVPAEPPNPPCRPPRVCCWLRNPASGHLPPDHGHQTPDPAGVIRQPDSNKQPDGHGRRHLGLSCAVAGQEFVPSVCSATPESHLTPLGSGRAGEAHRGPATGVAWTWPAGDKRAARGLCCCQSTQRNGHVPCRARRGRGRAARWRPRPAAGGRAMPASLGELRRGRLSSSFCLSSRPFCFA